MEQAVIIHIHTRDGECDSRQEQEFIQGLEDKLQQVIAELSVGEFDGVEFGAEEWVFFMYGPDADRLFDAIAPELKTAPAGVSGYAIKRYGEAGDPSSLEVRVSW